MTDKRGALRPIRAPEVTLETALDALGFATFGDDRPLSERLLRLCVNYRPKDAQKTTVVEPGVITGVGDKLVHVRYWGQRESKATNPQCLSWAYPL